MPAPRLPRPSDLTALPSAVVDAGRGRVRALRRTPVDLTGWTAPELRAWLPLERAPRGRTPVTPPRRAGHRAVRDLNALAGQLPTEAVLLGRAVADAAPVVGLPISPALHDILETYLPGTIDAYRISTGGGTAGVRAEGLLVEQLRLLHEVTGHVLQAQADHDDHDLRVQAEFLAEKFRSVAPGSGSPLDLPPVAPGPARALDRERTTPAAPRGLATSGTRERHHLHVDRDPVALVVPDPRKGLQVRLALPRGIGVTFGIAYERRTGATAFDSKRIRGLRAGSRQRTGFNSAQINMVHTLDLTDLRRFVVHATSTGRDDEPVEAVLFVTRDGRDLAAVPTLLARRRGLATTLVASGWDTTDGIFLRNESTFWPSLRAACTAHGFDQVTWLSADTPAI